MSRVDSEAQVLIARTGYMEPIFQRAVGFALRGPRWVPALLRRMPLTACCLILRFELWRLRAMKRLGGMGAVAPMVMRGWPSKGSVRAAGPLHTDMPTTRPDQQKKTPASAGTTPGAMTNIGECNVDRTDCRS